MKIELGFFWAKVIKFTERMSRENLSNENKAEEVVSKKWRGKIHKS